MVAPNHSFAYAKIALDQWVFVDLSILCALLVSGSALAMVLTRFETEPQLAGLAFSSTLLLITEARFGIRLATEVEARLNAVDRLKEYAELEQEAPAMLTSDKDLPEG